MTAFAQWPGVDSPFIGVQKRRPTNITCCGKTSGKLIARGLTLTMSLCHSNQFRKMKTYLVVKEQARGTFNRGGRTCHGERCVPQISLGN